MTNEERGKLDAAMSSIVDDIAAVIGKRPCERCRQSNPEPPCSEHDCKELYRKEAKDVLNWLLLRGKHEASHV